MDKIKKSATTMTSRERVLRTFAYDKTDRVPINYSANTAIHNRLAKHFGINTSDYDGIIEVLGVDFSPIIVPYIGKSLFTKVDDSIRVDPVYGFNTRYVPNESGGYWDFCDYPLLNAADDVIASFPVPCAEDFDYSVVDYTVNKYDTKAIFVGSPGIADIINSTCRVMGMEQTLINLLTEDEPTLEYITRRCQMEINVLDKTLQQAKGRVDFLWMGEDLGTQHTSLISLDLYRTVLKPFHKLYIELAKSYNIPIMIHTCGSSSFVYEDFIEMGVAAVDTLQPEAANMSPEYLTKHFGKRLAFHGCISTAGALAYGSEKDVEQHIYETLEIMKPNGGYFLAPTHLIQDNTPVENIVAMYNAAHKFGVY